MSALSKKRRAARKRELKLACIPIRAEANRKAKAQRQLDGIGVAALNAIAADTQRAWEKRSRAKR